MTTVARRSITDLVIEACVADPEGDQRWEVGDHEAPNTGGWQGEPDSSQFIAYVAVTALPSSPAGPSPIEDPDSDVNFTYALTYIGSSRTQSEWLADKIREQIPSLNRTDTPEGRRIGWVRVTSYGRVDPVRSVEPPVYGITDRISLWTTPA